MPAVPRLVNRRQVGRKLELVVVGFDERASSSCSSRSMPRRIEVIEFNLEDAFIEYTRGPRRGLPIFVERAPMLRVMITKELRETAGIVAIAAAVLLALFSRAMRHDLLPWYYYGYFDYNAIPFVNRNSLTNFAWVSAGLALALGFRQTVGESIHGTWLFLLHRPVGWRWLIGVKLLVGLAVYLVARPRPCWPTPGGRPRREPMPAPSSGR